MGKLCCWNACYGQQDIVPMKGYSWAAVQSACMHDACSVLQAHRSAHSLQRRTARPGARELPTQPSMEHLLQAQAGALHWLNRHARPLLHALADRPTIMHTSCPGASLRLMCKGSGWETDLGGLACSRKYLLLSCRVSHADLHQIVALRLL